MKKPASFKLAGQRIVPGSRHSIRIPAARLYNDTPMDLHAEVFHGVKPGPVLLVCAAIHGDELNGIEICRRVISETDPLELSGTLIVVPVVNVFGFIQQSRYLPDRRDLNRCFPGSERGALGSRLAHLFNETLVQSATHIIDLHTGAVHRSNLPQIRVDTDNSDALAMGHAFNSPVILHSKERDGSLRSLASELGIPLILYEAGEALRFDYAAIKAGVIGVQNVMKSLKMLKGRRKRKKVTPVVAHRSAWIRNDHDGLVVPHVELGQTIQKGQVIAFTVNPHGDDLHPLRSPFNGIIIGISNIPVANEGEALFNVAQFDEDVFGEASSSVDVFSEAYDGKPV
ncbi:N-alpha-acetyl-L-2,4-diaminobutyric acid deacetylase [Pseudidiomarina piscicola]|uniref:N-alpha-acetyl-L-2,4-diaminobutyric acid deacetylase n=1 Tax=Pseudidiomarina piscicola TaxID=2614830 RepID=A0A6S6WRU7_9GAMM|nr:succinylglutamate desuccinylase/aspartoacylase family protein [Pseudidiomarina piscicola]CAB0151098.1 N-alpha-acetyl-L-2,4-diaminobutyric acid deacetylase [Pseudidiomarina piscicola]VZT40606.1 N-alpha-acetyl-L-2,4-diaminobutyric acid deacetylase [Pseudomonas aeruginosa]